MSSARALTSRLLGELAIIVVGVLIALWADGLADARAERRDLDDHLRAVRDELRDEIETLDEMDERLDLEATALQSLASSGTSGVLPSDSVLIELVYAGILDVTVFEPTLGTLDDLRGAGLVPLIRDLDLRLALSQLRHAVATAARHAEFNRTGPQQRLFDPFVLQELPFVWRSVPAIQDVSPWSGQVLSWDPLFDDRGQAIVTMRYDLLGATKEDWEGLRIDMERLIALIDGYLESRR